MDMLCFHKFKIRELVPQESWLRGKTAAGFIVYGRYFQTIPGIGLEVLAGGNKYILMNELTCGSLNAPTYFTLPSTTDCGTATNVQLSPETRLFWLKQGYSTKESISPLEYRERRLIDPMSEEGLKQPYLLAPILEHEVYGMIHMSNSSDSQEIHHFLETGKPMPYTRPHFAPLPLAHHISETKKKILAKWHWARALRAPGYTGPWFPLDILHIYGYDAYSFSEDRMTLEHKKYTFGVNKKPQLYSVMKYNWKDVNYEHTNTPASSAVNSPACRFVLRPPPCIAEEEDTMSPMSAIEGINEGKDSPLAEQSTDCLERKLGVATQNITMIKAELAKWTEKKNALIRELATRI
jgi:hypothetical protein